MVELKKYREFWLALPIVILFVGLAWHNDEFLTLSNLCDPASNYAILTILACSLFVVLVSGGIDIPFPVMTIIAQYGMVLLLQKVGGNFIVAFALADCIGTLFSLIDTLLVDHLRMPSIIITTPVLNIFYGLLLWLSKGAWLCDFPPWFEQRVILFEYTGVGGYDYNLSLPLIAMIMVILLIAFIMNFTNVGRKIYTPDGNHESTSHVGFSVLKLQLFIYGYMGLTSSTAGVIQSWTAMTVASDSLLGYGLTVLVVMMLGGIGLLGRRDTLAGTLLGVVLLAAMQDGLNLLGVSSYWRALITGIIIVADINAMAWSQYQNRSLL